MLFKLMMCAIVLFFVSTYVITFIIDSFFVCQKYVGIILELHLFETEKESFVGGCRPCCFFICNDFFVHVIVFLDIY